MELVVLRLEEGRRMLPPGKPPTVLCGLEGGRPGLWNEAWVGAGEPLAAAVAGGTEGPALPRGEGPLWGATAMEPATLGWGEALEDGAGSGIMAGMERWSEGLWALRGSPPGLPEVNVWV
jgi:hypothetical protein